MERYICLHGHFYQPPRENPWLEAIEVQDSAYPYHDWNERITAECYAPNVRARILDGEGRIERIVNNYSRISFNFGPTLLAWMEAKQPEIYEEIIEADRKSLDRFDGHGSAVAQAYNHMIMPLANRRDKWTQILWGIEDFRFRFDRDPEGMWLAETAVDLETLELLADAGIKYTILSPYQATRSRLPGSKKWQDTLGGNVDPTTPYVQKLKGGKTIAIFFYDGPISQGIAFEKLLERGEDFAHRLMGAFNDDRPWDQIVHIGTDGETYGHHHRHGEMALAYALQYIDEHPDVTLTNYGEYLANHPDLPEVEITERTAWSCAHGVERWNSNCGCNSGGHGDWNQEWRRPLRESLDWLRDELADRYEDAAGELLNDPWAARDEYISVILNRSDDNISEFFKKHAKRILTDEQEVRASKLLEMQRHAMLMYTSCGWFFDELSGIETVQVIEYAGYAVQLALDLFDASSIEEGFLSRLAHARSNIDEHGTGRDIYERWVKPARVDLQKVAAHYAASSIFENYGDSTEVHCYRVYRDHYRLYQAGTARLVLGRCTVESTVTQEQQTIAFACMHLGDHNLIGGVVPCETDDDFEAIRSAMQKQIVEPFRRADFPDTIGRIQRYFHDETFSLATLFQEEQRKIIDSLLDSAENRIESAYRAVYEQYLPLSRYLSQLNVPQPPQFRHTAQMIINTDLRRAWETDVLDEPRIHSLISAANSSGSQLDTAGLSFTIQHRIEGLLSRLDPDLGRCELDEGLDIIERVEQTIDLAQRMPFEITFADAQNIMWRVLQNRGLFPGVTAREVSPDDKRPADPAWADRLAKLGRKLHINV